MAELMFGNGNRVQQWQRDDQWNMCKGKIYKMEGSKGRHVNNRFYWKKEISTERAELYPCFILK
jgi:hypothetical protein